MKFISIYHTKVISFKWFSTQEKEIDLYPIKLAFSRHRETPWSRGTNVGFIFWKYAVLFLHTNKIVEKGCNPLMIYLYHLINSVSLNWKDKVGLHQYFLKLKEIAFKSIGKFGYNLTCVVWNEHQRNFSSTKTANGSQPIFRENVMD